MPFLNAARPLLTENDSLVIRINAVKDGAITVLVEPHVKLNSPETDDAELASLQAALAMPLMLRFDATTTDLDAALSQALGGMTKARKSTVSALTAYEEAQAEARNQAALASKEKADKAKAGKTATKPSSTTGKPLPGPTSNPAASTTASTPPPAPVVEDAATTSNIFE